MSQNQTELALAEAEVMTSVITQHVQDPCGGDAQSSFSELELRSHTDSTKRFCDNASVTHHFLDARYGKLRFPVDSRRRAVGLDGQQSVE